MLIIAGDQVPVTPFGDVGAKIGALVPEQKAGMTGKSGVILARIFIVVVVNVPEAHCPTVGIKV